MTDLQEGSIYARVAILQWAADILHGEYASFGNIPAKDIAVLLHAIFNTPCEGGSMDTGGTALVSLHDIQFCQHPTPTTLFLNAKRVLSLVQTLSSSVVDGNGDMNVAEGCGGCSRPLSLPAVGNMTVSAWMEGKAFVEELKMWRWIRAEAFRRGLEKEELERRAQKFLHGAADPSKVPSSHEGTTTGRALELESGPSSGSVGKHVISPRKRSREEDTGAPNAPEAALDLGTGANNQVRGPAATDIKPESGRDGGVRNCMRTDIVVPRGKRGDESTYISPQYGKMPSEDKGEAMSLPHMTCDGVAVAPKLLKVLEEVKKELKERKVAAEASAAACGGITGSITTASRGSEPHLIEEACGSGHPVVGCSSCPAIFSEALQQNYSAIERLETARRLAVAACLKKDAAGLLEALAFI
ncbi:hypothetical protein C3747_31g185 [Trypanosoma cruzi]|uniref:Uncharacterized protein n=2 Tax=Trypanosoma cruzi TaxID=5693 RepID=Q4DSR5_TRYCC|nr:hypothetical protein, conserved [Trypanosoma cruzi]EAN95577.1 hypothetical protein, conserved [Trypanosoma cruzi]PWV15160.1 hypothetical protein C3747_31g185 [Trypanosoma cruzi]RNC61497.1 hypothetical protein TcCL_ESM00780 [Trypanosoma cruzi]|eukprot:XP_817428.1 hypothetical protein [Trypanosoma cruzi strain CL Brener]